MAHVPGNKWMVNVKDPGLEVWRFKRTLENQTCSIVPTLLTGGSYYLAANTESAGTWSSTQVWVFLPHAPQLLWGKCLPLKLMCKQAACKHACLCVFVCICVPVYDIRKCRALYIPGQMFLCFVFELYYNPPWPVLHSLGHLAHFYVFW